MFETKIYIASVKSLYDNTLFEKLYKTVPEYRRKKIDSYSDIKDKCLSLGCGLLLSKALKEASIDENELEYSFKESGMPYFKNHPEINFSISHSEEMVIVALSPDPIGVDVELIKDQKEKDYEPFNSMLKLIKKFDGLRIYRLPR